MKLPVCVALGWQKLFLFLCVLLLVSPAKAVPLGDLGKNLFS